jgi:hypothetical protein
MPLFLDVAMLKVITNHTKGEERYTMHHIMPTGPAKRKKMVDNKESFKANQAFANKGELKDSTLEEWEKKIHYLASVLHRQYRLEKKSLAAITDDFNFHTDFGITKASLKSDYENVERLNDAKKSVIADLLSIGITSLF